MLRNINEEQNNLLMLFQENPQYKILLDKIEENDDLKEVIFYLLNEDELTFTYLIKICKDSELNEQMSILNTITFMEYIKCSGYSSLLNFIKDLSKNSMLSSNQRIDYVKTIFSYIDYLVSYKDEINTLVSEGTMKKGTLEALSKLYSEIEDDRLKELIEKNRALKVDNKELSEENDRLNEQNTSLNSEVSSLTIMRDSLNSEIELLNRQIENRRLAIKSLLDEEMIAEKTKRILKLDEEIKLEKQRKSSEIEKLEEIKNKLLLKVQELENKFEEYNKLSQDNPRGYLGFSLEPTISWEHIDEGHEIYLQNWLTIDGYIRGLKVEYMLRSGKTFEQTEEDFEKYSPKLNELIGLVCMRKNINNKYNSAIIMYFSNDGWNEQAKKEVNKIKAILEQIKLPKYQKSLDEISNFDMSSVNLQSYLTILEMEGQLAVANMRQKIVEAKYLSLVNAVKDFIPVGYEFGIPDISSELSQSENKRVKKKEEQKM